MSGFDIIGDVHGCADKLKGLLHRLQYEQRNGVFQHPRRKAIFVGDLIDRGSHKLRHSKSCDPWSSLGAHGS
jgi:hypothetical protein